MLRRAVPYVVLLCGLALLGFSSNGFRAFTTEGARRLQISENPRQIPAVEMTDMYGKSLHISDLKGRLVLVDFIYTWCPDICYAMGSTLEQVQRLLLERGLAERVAILSISFDPARDDKSALQEYAARFGAKGNQWKVAVVHNPEALELLLQTFDVTVLPVADGGFEHNGAIHLVDQQGRLARILDFNSPQTVVQAVETLL